VKKTLVSHFYNEAWLLPHWLKHHREIFDHGIMIDYRSTDRSCEIIRELCPTWEIRLTRNADFSASSVDSEVAEIERTIEGWRTTLNTTEFLIGNYDHLNDDPNPRQIFVEQYMFVDMERRDEPYYLTSDLPLYKQRWHGYGPEKWDHTKTQAYGSVTRPARSVHNHAIDYNADGGTLGRHFWNQKATYPDLAIFYYGYASLEEGSIKRKMQIQTQIPSGGTNHHFNLDQLMDRFKREQQPLSSDIRAQIKPLVDAHENYLFCKNQPVKVDFTEHKTNIQNAIDVLNTTLSKLQ